MLKRILLPLDPTEYTVETTNMAIRIAKMNDAEITGLVVLDIPGIARSIGPTPIGGLHFAEKLSEKKQKQAKETITKLLDEFKKRCEKAEVRHSVLERQGVPSESIMEVSMFYDIIIMGLRTNFNFESSDEPKSSLSDFLKSSPTSVMAIPLDMSKYEDFLVKKKVLVAFDGSYTSSKALHRFARLAKHELVETTVIMSHKDKEYAEYNLRQAEAFIKAHAPDITVETKWIEDEIVDVVKKELYDEFDSFVVGAHSSWGITRFFTGSLCNYLIERGEKMVIIGL